MADLLDELGLGAKEERHAPDGAHVDVVEHVAAERVRQLLEHQVVVLGVAVDLAAEVALNHAPYRLGDAVTCQVLIDALQPRA
eukprot:5190986-Pleurochrysis_carterae.AAC.1